MKLMKCRKCGEYTMKPKHHGASTVSAHPIASGVEKYVEQRVKMRLSVEQNESKK